ncbi:ABC transporter permease [Natronorubrum sp. FCH18a]|uniref:ABC transporter permease n=1 Tax=Natronorubrum sp. FCH18a TaxID=3447018 RepID=UPI003F50E2FE
MRNLLTYVLKRLGYTAITMLLISIIVFGVTVVLPGNSAEIILGREATPAKVAALEQQLGLNRPVYVQYLDWITGFVTGDWGTSYTRNGRSVFTLIIDNGWRSFQLAILTMATVSILAIPLGVIAAVYHNSKIDLGISGLSYLGISIPEFVMGTGLLILFAGPVFSVFPAGGYTSIQNGGVTGWLSSLVLPVVTMSILLTAHVMRLTRTEVIETLREEYVRTARLKGLGEYKVLFKHTLRNALLPTITLLALDLGYLMGGIVVVEEVFAYPGLGSLLVDAVISRDIPVLQSTIMVTAIAYSLSNLGADILYSYLDPRISYGADTE